LQLIVFVEQALGVDREAAKAYFRRGQAFLGLNEFEKANEDLQHALILLRGTLAERDVRTTLNELAEKRKQHDQRMKTVYGRMFGSS
jgi:tetratricopeptide (TPR) repeat protein